MISRAISSDASSDQCSAVLKATTRTGSLCWPDIRSLMVLSRSAPAIIGFGKGDAKLSVIVDDKVIILIVAVRHDGRGPACFGHVQNSNATKKRRLLYVR